MGVDFTIHTPIITKIPLFEVCRGVTWKWCRATEFTNFIGKVATFQFAIIFGQLDHPEIFYVYCYTILLGFAQGLEAPHH